jgi:hypothetical protein
VIGSVSRYTIPGFNTHRQDTTIRWSAAKYIARIASRVPDEFCDQLLDAVLDLYTLHYVEGEDMSPTMEPSWHGATLACAEFARQGLVSATKVPIVLHWVLKVGSGMGDER